jgi:hypothetical protein
LGSALAACGKGCGPLRAAALVVGIEAPPDNGVFIEDDCADTLAWQGTLAITTL